MVDNLNYGGLERLVAEIARNLDPSRFEPHVMGLDYLGHFATGLEKFATLHVASPMTKWSMARPASLANDVRGIAPDVVHLHSGVWYKGSLAAKLADVPFQIYTDHGRQNPDPLTNRVIDRLASSRSDVVVAVSQRLGDDLTRFVRNADRIRVVPNGVDTNQYAPRADDGILRAELGIRRDQPIVGSIGRLESVKGYSVMIAAFARLLSIWREPCPPALVIMGDGSERETLEAEATRLGVREKMHILGWRTDIERAAAAFTLFTMSSHSEGTSVSLLEAMSSGLCPVVTNVGGNPIVLGARLAHRLVPPADPEALALAWRDALTDGERRMIDGTIARERIVNKFSLAAMVSEYEAIYEAGPPAR